jgi:hypothetical protein
MSFNNEWVVLEYMPGDLQAEILRGLLEAQGIPDYVLGSMGELSVSPLAH